MLGQKVITALGIETSPTHMEWFAGPKGLKFSEIGCRPPGVRAWDLYAAANEFDIYREWAMAVVHGRPSQAPSRRFSAGIIALRPSCDGTIVGYEGIDEVHQRFGPFIIDQISLLRARPPSRSRRDTWPMPGIRLKHYDYDTLRAMLDFVGQTAKVRAR